MADNVTTYKTVVDVEVKGDDQVKDLGDKVEQSDEKFVSLRRQIRETTVALQAMADKGETGTKAFKELSDHLDELQDQQKRVAFQSAQIEDKLAALPGPIGVIGKGFASAKEAVDTFGKTLTVSLGIIGLLVAAFFAIKDALGKTKEGQEGLSKAMTAFNDVVAPLFAILEKVGTAILPILTKGFEALGQVMAKVAGFFGVTNDKIKEVHGTLEQNNELVKKAAEEQKKNQEELTKKQEEEQKKRAEADKRAAEKAKEEAKKRAEEKKKAEEDANKILVEAYITTLSDRDKELYKRGQKLQEDLLALEKAGVKDRTSVLEAYRLDEAAINKKFDDDAKKKQEEKDKQDKEKADKAKEEAEKAAKDKLERENKAREDSANLLQADYDYKQALGKATFQDELDLFDKTRELGHQTMVANKESADAITAYDEETAAQRIKIEKAQQAAKMAVISDALGTVAEMVGKQTVAGKALAVAQATINTYLGATQALATYPPPFGAIAAATVIAAGFLQVKQILATQLPEVPKPGGGSTSASGAGPAIATPSIPNIAAPQVSTTGGTNPTSQIATTLAAASGKPIKAYVVSGDIQSQTALDRRTNRAATFSGG